MIENFTQKNERTVDGSEIPRPTTEFGRPKPWKSMGFYKLFPQLVANSSGFLVAINSITLKNVCCLKNGSFPFHTDRPHWWMIILQHLHLRFGSNRSGCSNYHHDRRVLLHHAPRLPTKKTAPSRPVDRGKLTYQRVILGTVFQWWLLKVWSSQHPRWTCNFFWTTQTSTFLP